MLLSGYMMKNTIQTIGMENEGKEQCMLMLLLLCRTRLVTDSRRECHDVRDWVCLTLTFWSLSG